MSKKDTYMHMHILQLHACFLNLALKAMAANVPVILYFHLLTF